LESAVENNESPSPDPNPVKEYRLLVPLRDFNEEEREIIAEFFGWERKKKRTKRPSDLP
jgi:hypothetical protein